LKNNHLSPNAISHKDLKALLTKAKKEISTIQTSGNDEIIENKDFNNLITDWTTISKKILLSLNKKDQVLTKNRSPKSLIAFGAMGAHINMALQALKATEFEN
tara:strand:- start:1143 stop:1451 length:309 start_codon:yes stop_codon:yes gene_type:complete